MTVKSSELIGKKVVIAPFNQDAVFTYYRLEKQGVEVIAFLDRDRSFFDKQYLGIPIFPYVYLHDVTVIIANTATFSSKSIEESLIMSGFKDTEWVRQTDIEFEVSFCEIAKFVDVESFVQIKGYRAGVSIKREIACAYAKPDEKFDIKFVSVDITNRCSLNCRYCCTLMPFHKPEVRRDFDIDISLRSIDTVVDCVDFIPELSIMGGEPLLHKNLKHLLKGLNQEKFKAKIGNLILNTNGTVLPDAQTLEEIKRLKNHIYLNISAYGKLSRKQYELLKLCNQYGIAYVISPALVWADMCQPFAPYARVYTEEEAKANCARCCFVVNTQFRILEDRLYKCSFLSYTDSGKIVPADKNNYLNILDGDFSSKRLRDYLSRFQPGRVYCSHPINHRDPDYEGPVFPAAEQTSSVPDYADYTEYVKYLRCDGKACDSSTD